MKNGLIHIYCGDGKGKTTAAVGLSVRCAGGGGKVLFFQFMKGNSSGERESLKQLKNIDLIDGYENLKFVWNMTDSEKAKTAEYYTDKFKEIVKKACDENYDLIIMDEIISAVNCEFVPLDTLTDFLRNKPQSLEVVITGRDPHKELIDIADYVSEIKKIKHPFDKGIKARKLIER